MLITIRDESMTGMLLNKIELEFQNELITVKDLIAVRVEKEVENYNENQSAYFNGFVQPTNAEQTLNGFLIKNRKKIDPEKQIYVALDAFQKNVFFILIDDRQAEDLDEEVLVNEKTIVSFVKLTPLVGG